MPLNTNIITPRLIGRLRGPGGLSDTQTVDVLLKFRDDASLDAATASVEELAKRLGVATRSLRLVRIVRPLRYVALTVEVGAIAALSDSADILGVTTIDEDADVVPFDTPGDDDVSILAANPFGLSGQGVRVAVVDTGVDGAHPDLAGRVVAVQDFSGSGPGDRQGHGTHCAGLVAGTGAKNEDRRALAFGAEIVDCKVLGDDGHGKTSAILSGIVWAVDEAHARVVSMSLGVIDETDGPDPLDDAVAWAVGRGAVVFAAAGNCGPSGSVIACPVRGPRSIASPGTSPAAVTVGAIDIQGQVAGFSSRGPTRDGLIKPDVVILGHQVPSLRAGGVSFGTIVDDYYTVASGTSMATPQCAAIGALLLEAADKEGRALDAAAVKALLRSSAIPIADTPATSQGAGVVSAAAALQAFYGATGGPAPAELRITMVAAGPDLPRVGARKRFRVALANVGNHDLHQLAARIGGGGARVLPAIIPADPAALVPAAERSFDVDVEPERAGTMTIDVRATFKHEGDGEEIVATASQSLEVAEAAFDVSSVEARSVLDDAVQRLLAAQTSAGTWVGGIMFNAWTNGMYCILHKLIGMDGEPTAALKWLSDHRDGLNESGVHDGSYGMVDPPSIHMIEATYASQVALEIWGRPRDPAAWKFLNDMSAARLASAITNADPFTQIFVALASRYRPAGTPVYHELADILAPPIEILAIPSFVKPNVASMFAAWGQDSIAAAGIITTLLANPDPPFAKRLLLAKAERQLLRNQRDDGSWYCTALPTFACTLAMHVLGYTVENPVMRRAQEFIRSRQRPDGYVSRFDLPVWDSAIAILALREAGVPANHPKLVQAAHYLVSAQAFSGGVPFRKENEIYPDTDDTAFAVLATHKVAFPDTARRDDFTRRAIEWLLFMQGNSGGWAAFEKDQAVKSPARAPFFKDDPPTADVTGHVLSCLRHAPPSRRVDAEEAKKQGFQWLQSQQLAQGGWYGRWGMTVTYAATAVLQAVEDLGEPPDQPFVSAAVQYLVSKQQADGGWGEGYATYYDVYAEESVESTVEQTAWSVLGLLSVPLTPASRTAVERGIRFMLDRYSHDGGFGQSRYTVGALWIYRHTLYSLLWPVWALAKYLKVVHGS